MNKTLRTTLGFVFLFIAGFCLWQAVPPSARREATMSPPVQAEFNSLRNVTENGVAGILIRDIRVGQRVLAHNPEVSDAERESWGEEPDFGRWLRLKLEMPKEDGGILHIEILRPEEWVESQLGYVVTTAEKSRRHTPRDEAKRDKTSASEDNRREEKTSHATLPDESILTAISNVKDSGVPAMPHHAVRDGYVGGTVPQASSVDEFPLPLVPLSPLRPIYFNLAMRSAAIGAAGAELVGLTVEMDLPEMGASGTAIITEILPASQIEPRMSSDDNRQVVTATFRHPPSNQILDVNFVSEADWQQRQHTGANAPHLKPETQNLSPCGEADTISVTDNHLFWSVDQQEFVEVGQMEIGERVQTFHGETKRLASRLPRPGPPEEVYNLEVYGEHVYFVGDGSLLAHNNCFLDDIIKNPHVADTSFFDSSSAVSSVRTSKSSFDGVAGDLVHVRHTDVTKGRLYVRRTAANGTQQWHNDRLPSTSIHGNSAGAGGPHDLYAMLEPGTRRVLHIGETGRGWDVRTAEHIRDAVNQRNAFENAPSPLIVVPKYLRTVDGKAAALALQDRYIRTYESIFGELPLYNAGYR